MQKHVCVDHFVEGEVVLRFDCSILFKRKFDSLQREKEDLGLPKNPRLTHALCCRILLSDKTVTRIEALDFVDECLIPSVI